MNPNLNKLERLKDDLLNLEKWLRLLEDGQTKNAETAVADAIGIYKTAASYQKATAEIWGDIQQRAKQIIVDVAMETGQTDWRTGTGSCYLPRPGVFVRYDAKALDTLCQSDPELAAKLAPFRSEAERPGSLTIR